MRQPLEVEILGQKLTVSSDDGEEHIRHLANFVEEQMRQAAGRGSHGNTLQLALIAALNIASEYWKLQHQQEELDQTITRMAQRLSTRLDRA